MLRYDLYNNGRVKTVGFQDDLPYESDGSEPWLVSWETEAFDWQYTSGQWSKWRDVLEEVNPVFISSQDISNKPGNPNITRKAFILRHDHDWYSNALDIYLGIRHFKSGIKFLDYDIIIILEVRDNYYQVFLTKQSVDGLNNTQALQFIVNEADIAGVIDSLIDIY